MRVEYFNCFVERTRFERVRLLESDLQSDGIGHSPIAPQSNRTDRFHAVQLLSHIFKEHQAGLGVAIHVKDHVLRVWTEYGWSQTAKHMGFEVPRVRFAEVHRD